MLDQNLELMNGWFKDPSSGDDKARLISKLALLELCGYLEERMDALVIEVGVAVGLDENFVREQVIRNIYGFKYAEHFRPMLAKVIGEHGVRLVEQRFCETDAGRLDDLKAPLGSLWRSRCNFAHKDLAANIDSQEVFNAPSWVQIQHRTVKQLLDDYDANVRAVANSLAGVQPLNPATS